ncbi:hypothetical protein [Actinoplanes sp. OR16]|uniref:hypothetical protein n=1 Tax=Actinoplanes sp. OR16 TaxID=946334 RepID=UPI000FDBEEF6|nr:hypothetical protein [Actinoplanes sp. OR16]
MAQESETDHRARADSAVLVALAWCIVVTVVTLVVESEILTGGRDCGDQSWCLGSEAMLTIGLVAGAPLWLGYMLVSWLITLVVARGVRSPFLAGTLAAGAAAALIFVVANLLFGG